jgi:hypothetical protein
MERLVLHNQFSPDVLFSVAFLVAPWPCTLWLIFLLLMVILLVQMSCWQVTHSFEMIDLVSASGDVSGLFVGCTYFLAQIRVFAVSIAFVPCFIIPQVSF